MIVCFVKHENHSKPFLFELGTSVAELKRGDTVICDTRFGEATGVIVGLIRIDTDLDVLAKACGATLPLKKVLRKYVKPIVTRIEEIPERFIAQIRNEERAKIIREINGVQDALPFD